MGMSEMIGNKKRYRAFKARTARLPAGYRETVDALERYLTYFGPTGEWDSMQAMLDDLAELFEQSAEDQVPVRGVVGDDPVGFAEEFLRTYPGGSWLSKERDRLTEAVDRAADGAS